MKPLRLKKLTRNAVKVKKILGKLLKLKKAKISFELKKVRKSNFS